MTQTRVPPPPLCRGLLTNKYCFSSKSNIDMVVVACSYPLMTCICTGLFCPDLSDQVPSTNRLLRSDLTFCVQRIAAQLASLPSAIWFSAKTLKLIEFVFFFHILCLSCSDVLKCPSLPDVPPWVWPTSRHLVYTLSFSFIRTPLIQSSLVCTNWL